MTGEEEWPPMIWIGGTQGSGKSTIARSLARSFDLAWHPIDLFTYEHASRLRGVTSLDEELSCGTERAADAFEAHSRARLDLVLQDIRDRRLGDSPAVVEGPQLMPNLGAAMPPGTAVWLVASATRTLTVRESRLTSASDPAARRRLSDLANRDAVLTERTRLAAAQHQRPVIEVPDDPDWAAIRRHVQASLSTALTHCSHLSAGRPLRRQRRYENLTACNQGRLWQRDAGLSHLPPYAFACECGRSDCSTTWSGTPDQYDAATVRDRVRGPSHA